MIRDHLPETQIRRVVERGIRAGVVLGEVKQWAIGAPAQMKGFDGDQSAWGNVSRKDGKGAEVVNVECVGGIENGESFGINPTAGAKETNSDVGRRD